MKYSYLILSFVTFTMRGNIFNFLRKKNKKKSLYCLATFQREKTGPLYLLSFFNNPSTENKKENEHRPILYQLQEEKASLNTAVECFPNHIIFTFKLSGEKLHVHYSKKKEFYVWWELQPIKIIKKSFKKM